MTGKRLALMVLALVLAAGLLAPATCSHSSDEARPRCDTLLGYWTPFGESMQALVVVAGVFAVVAFFVRRRRAGR